jgi:hypothetical protein
MAAKVIKEFRGFSGNQVLLMKKHDMLFVRKIGNIKRNVERQYALENKYPFPAIYGIHKNNFEMEYIHGLDMKTYLTTHSHEPLINFLIDLFDKFSDITEIKNYRETYILKLAEIEFQDDFPFTKEELLDRLPNVVPQTEYHGDLTLENILYNDSRGFVLIDCQTVEYDSFIFDIAKMRQDLECRWFLRNDNVMIDVKLKHIQKALVDRYPQSRNDYLLILMLLRVYRYTAPNSQERKFILDRIQELWK